MPYVHVLCSCLREAKGPAPINSRLYVVVRPPTPFGLGRNGCLTSRESQLPRHSPLFFHYAPPWTTPVGQHTACLKSVACFLIFFPPAPLLPVFVSSFFSFSWWAIPVVYLLCVPTGINVTPFSDSSDMYSSTVQSNSSSANTALPPHPRLQTFYSPLAHSVASPSDLSPPFLASGCLSAPPASTPPWLFQGSPMECWRCSS